jgi:hypothetical protein
MQSSYKGRRPIFDDWDAGTKNKVVIKVFVLYFMTTSTFIITLCLDAASQSSNIVRRPLSLESSTIKMKFKLRW